MSKDAVIAEFHKQLLKKYPSAFSSEGRIRYRSVLSDLTEDINKVQAGGCPLMDAFRILAKHFPDKPDPACWASCWSQLPSRKVA